MAWWADLEPVLLSRASRFSDRRADAHDVVQDVAYFAIRELGSFNDAGHLRAWSLRRLHWLILDRQKSAPHQRTIADNGESALRAADASQEGSVFLKEIQTEIQRLTPRKREAFLSYLGGASTRETAQTMNVEEGTVRSLLRGARADLVRKLSENDDAIDDPPRPRNRLAQRSEENG